MIRIIRCPACAVVYTLEASQIQAAHGWLRCGQCHETFNGTGLDVPAPNASLPHLSVELLAHSAGQRPDETSPRIQLDELLLREDRSEKQAVPASEISADLMAFSEALATFKPVVPAHEPVSSVDTPTARSRPPVALYILAVTLGLLLMGQAFFFQRHAIAALWPSSLSVLESLCRPLRCQVEPWMNPAALVLEDSSFIQNGESFLLRWSLRNTGPMTVKTTSLELSLLDQFNNPVARRVLFPDEIKAPAVLSPGQIWTGSVPVQVDPLLVFSQHRLLGFYP